MATSKKDTEAVAAAAKPAPIKSTVPAPAAKPAAAKPAAKPASAKPAAAKPAAAKPVDPALQASKAALAKALADAQAVKIEKPLGPPAKPEKAAKPAKAPKARKPKLVRDSFTMPEDEYGQIAGLKKRLLGQGVVAKKSELLRAGVALLAAMADIELAAALAKVEKLKTGRPAKSGK